MYIIEYFRDSIRTARTPWAARLDKTVQVASRGLVGTEPIAFGS